MTLRYKYKLNSVSPKAVGGSNRLVKISSGFITNYSCEEQFCQPSFSSHYWLESITVKRKRQENAWNYKWSLAWKKKAWMLSWGQRQPIQQWIQQTVIEVHFQFLLLFFHPRPFDLFYPFPWWKSLGWQLSRSNWFLLFMSVRGNRIELCRVPWLQLACIIPFCFLFLPPVPVDPTCQWLPQSFRVAR